MNTNKRTLLLGAAALLGATIASANTARQKQTSARDLMQLRRFPNVPLQTHTGKTVKFYDDVLRDKKVVINVMYTVCDGICTPATQNLKEAKALLGELGKDIHFYSLTLTPSVDTPATLRAYMQAHDIPDGWTFLTGKPEHVERVRRGLGFVQQDPAQDQDLSNHSGMVRIGNEPLVSWSHASALNPGRSIARMIRFELT